MAEDKLQQEAKEKLLTAATKLFADNREPFQLGNPVQKQKTRVVAGPLIL